MIRYYPALRAKKGEWAACAKLQPDIRSRIEPRFIIPPLRESDPELGRPPTVDEAAYITAERIRKHWPIHRAFLDTRYVAKRLGDDGLRRLFEVAQGSNGKLVAVAGVKDLFNPVFGRFLRKSAPRIGIYVHYEKLDTNLLLEGVKSIGCVPEECTVFLDFHRAPFEIDGIATSIAGLFDELGMAARWEQIVFQGSAFPSRNKVAPGGLAEIPRLEWNAFHLALRECSISPDRTGYGDYGADSSEIKFSKGGGGPPFRHIRYTGDSVTLNIRGADSGTPTSAMQEVCRRLISREEFAGKGFSHADEQLYFLANGLVSAGPPSTWREWNMNHHITKVVRDLGNLAGIKFFERGASAHEVQENLFDFDQGHH